MEFSLPFPLPATTLTSCFANSPCRPLLSGNSVLLRGIFSLVHPSAQKLYFDRVAFPPSPWKFLIWLLAKEYSPTHIMYSSWACRLALRRQVGTAQIENKILALRAVPLFHQAAEVQALSPISSLCPWLLLRGAACWDSSRPFGPAKEERLPSQTRLGTPTSRLRLQAWASARIPLPKRESSLNAQRWACALACGG